MCKNRIKATVLGLAASLLLAGCGVMETLVTDTGSGESQSIAKENYLKTNITQQGQQSIDKLYKVLTLEKGTYEEVADVQMLKRNYINAPTLRLDVDGREVRFGEYAVQAMDYVEEGDVIATVHVEVDELELEEVKLRITRLQERFLAAEEQKNKDLQEIQKELMRIPKSYKSKILDVRYKQIEWDWEYTKFNYETQIKETKKELEELSRVGAVFEVKADRAGYVDIENRYPSGKELWDGAYICHILDNKNVYTVAERQADQFHYGMEVEMDTSVGDVTARVVSGGSYALYGNLEPTRAAGTGGMSALEAAFEAYYGNDVMSASSSAVFLLDFGEEEPDENASFNKLMLQGNLKTIENVIILPLEAVTQQNEQYYVTVLKEDGSLLKTEIIPGGNNGDEYWVLEGLTEGMQIVYN